MHLNKEQCKYLAGMIEKASIAYFALFGYTWGTKGDWFLVAHALVVFGVLQGIAVALLADAKEKPHEQ